jgi:hypothetical protein
MAGSAVKTLTVSGIPMEVLSLQLGAPTTADPIDTTITGATARTYIANKTDHRALQASVAGLVSAEPGVPGTLDISAALLRKGNTENSAGLSIPCWISSITPGTVSVDGERRVVSHIELHRYSLTTPEPEED